MPPPSDPFVCGLVLGAGGSRRLGRPKQTLPLGDTTVLGWTLRDAEQSSLDRVCVVLGGADDEAARAITPRRSHSPA
jgi:molybdenum cofactor cytidylyltransferase